MLLMTGHHPQRRRQSGPRVLQRAAQRSQSLDGRRSGGYSRHRCPTLHFQHVHAQEPPRLRTTATQRRFSFLVACFQQVYLEQPVNTSVFALIGCTALIPRWFPQSNLRFLHSSHSGVTCQPLPDAVGSAVLREVGQRPAKAHGRATGRLAAACEGF